MLNRHAVSRWIASRICEIRPCWSLLFFPLVSVSGPARKGCRYGFFVKDSKNHGSALKSPVWRTVPLYPWMRNLHYIQHNNHEKHLQEAYITAPGQWLASNNVIVTASSSLREISVGVLRGTASYTKRCQSMQHSIESSSRPSRAKKCSPPSPSSLCSQPCHPVSSVAQL